MSKFSSSSQCGPESGTELSTTRWRNLGNGSTSRERRTSRARFQSTG